jgi:hypothetical protein
MLMFQRPRTARVIPRGYPDRHVVGDVLKTNLEGRKGCEYDYEIWIRLAQNK